MSFAHCGLALSCLTSGWQHWFLQNLHKSLEVLEPLNALRGSSQMYKSPMPSALRHTHQMFGCEVCMNNNNIIGPDYRTAALRWPQAQRKTHVLNIRGGGSTIYTRFLIIVICSLCNLHSNHMTVSCSWYQFLIFCDMEGRQLVGPVHCCFGYRRLLHTLYVYCIVDYLLVKIDVFSLLVGFNQLLDDIGNGHHHQLGSAQVTWPRAA